MLLMKPNRCDETRVRRATSWSGRESVILGVIGGIGSGKSTIARLFCAVARERGARIAEIADADAIAHDALELGDVKARIREEFGAQVFDADGRVDRKSLGAIVFSDARRLQQLESWVHPTVERSIRARAEAFRRNAGPEDLLVLDVPLLASSKLRSECDLVVFVEVDARERERRVRADRGWDEGELERRERHQTALATKRERADIVINNSGPLANSREQVAACLSRARTERRDRDA